MVNVHGKYTDNANNNTAYQTDGSDVRDATAKEKLRYLDANKHKRKKATSTVESAETSKSDTAVGADIPVKPLPIPSRGEQRAGDISSSDGGRSDSKSTGRERADGKDERGSSGKSSDRGSSRKDGSQKSERRARTTEKEEKNDNDEEDQQMMREIRERIEARKVARDLKIARSTIDELKSEKSKKEAEKKAGGRRGSKKAIATQSATGIINAEPLASVGAVTRKSTPESTLSKDVSVEAAGPTRGRSINQSGKKSREDSALSTLKFGHIADDGSRGAGSAGDLGENALGIALVATALGKKLPRAIPTHEVVGIKGCRVEIPSLRRKTKIQVSVAPPNSIDSDDGGHADTGSELRLTQSDVHIGFPGDVCETIENANYTEPVAAGPKKTLEARSVATIPKGDGVKLFGIAMAVVAAPGKTTDAPTVHGEIATPAREFFDATVVKQPSVLPEAILTPTPNVIVPGSAEEKKAMKAKYDLKQKMLREIAASQLLQEELAKANPNLLNVSSFMNQVCGMDRGSRLLKETAESVIQRGRVEKSAA